MKLYALYIFDLDGTLIDSRDDLATAVNYMRQYFGLSLLENKVIFSYIGGGSKQLIELSLQDTNIDIEKGHSIAMDFYSDNCCEKTCFFNGVVEVLNKLKKLGCKLAISTNKPEIFAKKIMDELDATQLFEIIMGPESSALKPSPLAIENICTELGVSISDTLMVGDHHTDIEAAIRARCDSAFVSYGIGKLDENQYPTYTIDDFQRLC